MTDEVAQLVLADNEDQNDLIGTSRANAASLLPVHADQIKYWWKNAGSTANWKRCRRRRRSTGGPRPASGSPLPSCATLMAHVKLALKEDMLGTELPEQDVFASRLPRYFPTPLRERFTPEIRTHQLRREIVTTMLINDLVDTARHQLRLPDHRRRRRRADRRGAHLRRHRRHLRRGRHLAADPRGGSAGRAVRPDDAGYPSADRPRRTLAAQLPSAAAGGGRRNQPVRRESQGADTADVGVAARRRQGHRRTGSRGIRSAGRPEDLAYLVAAGLYRFSLLDIIDIADITEIDTAEVADTYFALMDRLGTDGLLTAVSELPRNDRWHSLARLAIRDDIYASLRSLCFDVLAVGEPDESGEEKIAEWEHISASRVERARRTLTEIYASGEKDLATLSVAARQIRRMTRTSGRGSSG